MKECWWVINEDELIEALKRAYFGESWSVVMTELLANSRIEDVE